MFLLIYNSAQHFAEQVIRGYDPEQWSHWVIVLLIKLEEQFDKLKREEGIDYDFRGLLLYLKEQIEQRLENGTWQYDPSHQS